MSTAELSLITSAAEAAGPAPQDPADYAAWRQRVQFIALDLKKLASEVDERSKFLDSFTFEAKQDGQPYPDRRRLHATIIGVARHSSGRGLVGVIAGPGNAVEEGSMTLTEAGALWEEHRSDNNAFGRGGILRSKGIEQFRTEFLNTAEGATVYAQAEQLVGQRVVIFKDMAEFTRDGETTKMRLVRHIEPSTAPAPGNNGTPSTRAATTASEAPADTAAPANGATTQQNATTAEAPAEPIPQDEAPGEKAERLLALNPANGHEIVELATTHLSLTKDDIRKAADNLGIADRANMSADTCKRLWAELVTSQLGEPAF